MSETTPDAARAPDRRRETWGVDHQDLVVMACGVMAVIGSVGSFYTVSVDVPGGGFTASLSAWHGFLGWCGALLAAVASGLLASRLLGLASPLTARRTVLALYVTATACTALAYVVFPGDPCADLVFLEGSCDAITLGRGSGYWRTLGAVLAGTLLAFLRRSGP